ncbi:Ketosteroid isomerase homolog [Bryocella elongata]|uniref:Ketosteroid isomerase homolog n=1 Tax=Bryocella elongata TaxID=863522 RepID=A0A1H5WKX8_9BACT|nr:nuclear transport factor 2 family protein [Bryocella elongata]SEF99587.1 Ketosteroid isomerase homolog [Bryocella elongata]
MTPQEPTPVQQENPQESVENFVAAINAHNLDAIFALLPRDHVFIDSVGHRLESAVAARTAWRGYFAMCPDYWIRLSDVLTDGELVLATGMVGGTIRATSWQTPAAFKVIIRNRKLQEWRVFADNKPVYEILARQ